MGIKTGRLRGCILQLKHKPLWFIDETLTDNFLAHRNAEIVKIISMCLT